MAKRSPELEAMMAEDESGVRDPGARRSQLLGGAALLFFGALAMYWVFTADSEPERDMLDGSDEVFRTTTFRPPSFVREPEMEEEPDEEIIQLPAPPPPPPAVETEESDTTQFDVPPPPPVVEQAQTPPPPVVELAEPVEEFPSRFASSMIVFDNSGGNAAGSLQGGAEGGGEGPLVAGEDRNSQFLAAASLIANRTAVAEQLERIDALVPEGTLIPGILETAVVSDLPGQMRAIVSEDVYSFDGRRVLIPTGTRLIGEYQSDITTGQTRIFVVWTRMIRNDGVSVRLNSTGADSLGRAGMTGHVDNKFRERFSSAILLSIVGAGASYATGFGSDQAFGSNNSDAQRAEDLARETVARTFSDMANQVLRENLQIPPTISVPQGERIFVYVRQDLDFSALYDDPVDEAMREILSERRN